MIFAAAGGSGVAFATGFAQSLVGTLGVRVRDNQGADTIARTTSGIVEINLGSGFSIYAATLTWPTAAGMYTIDFDNGSGLYASEALSIAAVAVPDVAPSAVFEAVATGFATGLTGTLGVRLLSSAGATITARTTGGITEDIAASGIYRANITAGAAAGHQLIVWDNGASQFAVESILVASAATLVGNAIMSPKVAVISIVQADDYSAADGRAFDFADATLPSLDLTGATIVMRLEERDADGVFVAFSTLGTGSVITASGATRVVRVVMSSAQTAVLLVSSSRYIYSVEATLASGRKVSLWRGGVVVLENNS